MLIFGYPFSLQMHIPNLFLSLNFTSAFSLFLFKPTKQILFVSAVFQCLILLGMVYFTNVLLCSDVSLMFRNIILYGSL